MPPLPDQIQQRPGHPRFINRRLVRFLRGSRSSRALLRCPVVHRSVERRIERRQGKSLTKPLPFRNISCFAEDSVPSAPILGYVPYSRVHRIQLKTLKRRETSVLRHNALYLSLIRVRDTYQ